MTSLKIAAAVLIATMPLSGPAAAKSKSSFGVFATINGKKFKAPSSGKAEDPCVFGTYEQSGGLVFTAGECRGRRHRPPNNYKLLVFICGNVNPPAPTPPFDAPCLSAGYTEARLKHHILFSMKEWLESPPTFEIGPDGKTIEHSSVNLHIESFDGTYVRGTFSGVFDMPPAGSGPAPIDGQGTFYFPVRGVAP